MNLPQPLQGRPGRRPAGSAGRAVGSRARRAARPAGVRWRGVRSSISPERSRSVPWASSRAGRSWPLGPSRSSFIGLSGVGAHRWYGPPRRAANAGNHRRGCGAGPTGLRQIAWCSPGVQGWAGRLIWRNTRGGMLPDSAADPLRFPRESRMEHPTLSHPSAGPMPERAPLTRLRASSRVAAAPAPLGPGVSLLPDARQWGTLFGGAALGSPETAALNEIARARRVAPGALVHGQGDAAAGLLLVVDGDVALGVRADEAGFRTERHMHGPAWLDLSAGWLAEPHALDARAMTSATIAELPREPLGQVLDRHPMLARRLITTLAREIRALAVNTHELMHKDAPGRLAAWLHQRCQADPALPGRAVVQLPMRKRDIASQLAITPETLSRLMRSFASQGVLQVAGYTVHVLDPAALERLALAD